MLIVSDSAIKAELESLEVMEFLNDTARGNLNPGFGRSYATFRNVVALRILQDWDVTCEAVSSDRHDLPLSLTVMESERAGRLALGLSVWKFSLDGDDITVRNAAETGELLVKFNKTVYSTEHREQARMLMGSFFYVKASPPTEEG